MPEEPKLPSPGDLLAGKYRVERLIGRGGMGAVFAAEHTLLGQRVALKVLLGELVRSPEATSRFMNEARAAAQIRGEHVVRVLDIGVLDAAEGGTPFMVLEYLEGADLAATLRQRGPLPIAEVVDFALQALDALAQAHAAGIIHRDLKPANLFLARRHDGTSAVKVLDFGVSKNLTPLGGTPQRITQTRALLGSPEYMSPEQLRTPRGVDARTDVWSMGVILYELLTGKLPFAGESVAELFVQVLESEPATVRSARAEVSPELEAVIARCLNRSIDARFPNVHELATALVPFSSDPLRPAGSAHRSAPGQSGRGASELPASTVALPPSESIVPRSITASGLAPVPAPTGSPIRTSPGLNAPAEAARQASPISLPPVVVPAPPPEASLQATGVATPAWASTGPSPAVDEVPAGLPPRRNRVASLVAASAIGLVVGIIVFGIFLQRAFHPRGTAAAVEGPPAAVAPEIQALPPTIPPIPEAVASASEPAPAASHPTAQAMPAPAPAKRSVAAPTHPSFASSTEAARQGSPIPAPAIEPTRSAIQAAPPAAPAAKNCNPKYFFDKDGNKHFKPECF